MRSQPSPRRVHVERGIYFRQTVAGRRYEIGYQGSDGRWRWRVVDGGLKEARAARAEVVSKLARGERVAPSRRAFAEVADAWLAAKMRLAPRTRQRYEEIVRVHLLQRFAARRISDISEDDVLRLIAGWRRLAARLEPAGRALLCSAASLDMPLAVGCSQ
jgi:hypothetical protein